MALGDRDAANPEDYEPDITKREGKWHGKWAFRAIVGSFLAGLIIAFMYFGTRAASSLDLIPFALPTAFGAALAFFIASQLTLEVMGGFVYLTQVVGFYISGLIMYYGVGMFSSRIKEIHNKEAAKRYRMLHILSVGYHFIGFSAGVYGGGLLIALLFSSLGGTVAEDALYGMVPSPGVYPGGGTVNAGFAFLTEILITAIISLVLSFFYLRDMLNMVPLFGAASILALTFVGFNLSGACFDMGIWFWGSLARCTIDGNVCFESPQGNEAVWWWEYIIGPLIGWIAGNMVAYLAVLPFPTVAKMFGQGQEMSANAPLVGAPVRDQGPLTQRNPSGRVDESKLGEGLF
jgi:hypothetical protein